MPVHNAGDLIRQFKAGKLSRREFTTGTLALGLSASVVDSVLGVSAAAQGTPTAIATTQTYPLNEEKVTITVLVPSNPRVEDFTTNAFTQWYEELTNVHVEWEVVPAQEALTSLNVRLAGGDYPCVIMDFDLEPALQMLYGSQGVFLPLNDFIEEYGAAFKQVAEAYPLTLDAIATPDGTIYSLPQVNDCYHCSMSQKLWIYKPWLDELGLEMPTTTEEYAEVLRAFKDRDPNGNDEADELPLVGATEGYQTALDLFFMNSFICDPGGNRLVEQDGEIIPIFATPEWRDGLEYLAGLYSEGLISSESFTQDNDQLRQLGDNPDAPIVGSVAAGHPGVFMSIDSLQGGRWTDYVTVPPLTGPGGVQIASLNRYLPFITGNFVITNACKHPELAFRWANGLYELETTMRSVFGTPGEDWRWAEEGEIGLNGEQAIWKRLSSFGGAQNAAWAQTGPSFRPNDLRLGEAIDPTEVDHNLEAILYRETKEKYEPYAESCALPPLFFTEAQAQQAAELGTVINDYVDETFALATTGQVDIEAEWENYLATLDGMGLSQYIQIHQDAYDAQTTS